MSIETIGVKKYAFQDLVCILLLLNAQDLLNLKCFVEPENSEDAKIIMDEHEGINEIEIQVKGSQSSVTSTNLAEHLAHFPNREAENCLYDRLLTNSNQLVVFVMTGRCNDETSSFISNFKDFYKKHESSKIKRDSAEAIRSKFSQININSSDSDLQRRRKDYVNRLQNKYGSLKVKKAFERLIIIEQANENSVLNECYEILRSKYSIPDDKHQSVIERLKTVVFNGKETKEDIAGIFRQELNKFIPNNLYPQGYVQHGTEDNLKQILSEKNALLIAGSPRIGKTYIARWLAAEYALIGFQIREINDMEEAFRFITDPSNDKRLVLIDDPFGALHSLPNATQAFQKFETLLNRLNSNRKLVIAQVEDRLLEVTYKKSLADVRTGNHQWLNFNNISPDFSNNLWLSLCNEYKIPDDLKDIVSTNLLNQELSLEAGCLVQLASHYKELNGNFNLDNITRLAHTSASNLANALETDGYKFILRALAITTNPNISVSENDLAYVLYNQEDTLLSVSDLLAKSISFSNTKKLSHIDKIITKYEPEYKLLAKDDDLLENLEFRQIITFNSKNLIFTHPYYRATAEYLVLKNVSRKENEIVHLTSKGIFCLSPKTSRASARNLDWIFNGLTLEENKSAIVNLAIKALKSSFPSTRDIAFKFLINNYHNLPKNIDRDLQKWVNSVSFFGIDDAEWINGEPIYPMGEELWLDDTKGLDYYFHIPSYDAQNDPFNNECQVTPEQAWHFLRMVENEPSKLNSNTFAKFLAYDEALIRAKAIRIWLLIPRDDDDKLLEQVFLENHPAIARDTLEGIISVWNDCSIERKDLLLNGLKRLASNAANACLMIEDLIIFDRMESIDNLPWKVFETVLPILLSSIPEGIYVSDARLYDIVSRSLDRIDQSMVISIIESWIESLEKQVLIKLPSDYMFGVTSILLAASIDNEELRRSFIRRLLDLHGTGAAVRIIHDLVDEWEKLTPEEKSLVIDKLKEERIDKCWLQAAALVQDEIPEAVQQLLLPDDISLENDSLFTLGEKNPELFLSVVQMYLGAPQPLWYLAVHHCGKKYWEPIIEKLAHNSSFEFFNKVWEEIYTFNSDESIVPLIQSLESKEIEIVFEILFKMMITSNPDFNPKTWQALFNKVENPIVKTELIKRIALSSNSILDRFSDLDMWILDTDIKREFWNHLPNDVTLMTISYTLLDAIQNTYRKDLSKEESSNSIYMEACNDAISMIEMSFEDNPPTHYYTCRIIAERLGILGADKKTIDKIENYSSTLLDKSSIEKSNISDEEKIQNWIN